VDGLSLPPGRGEIEIRFTGLSFVAPERMLFKYRLEPYDKAWQEAGNRRTAYYTNLEPGTYRFRVIACNNDGVWNEKGDSFAFTLQAPFYKTWWFKILTFLFGIAAIAGLFYWRVQAIRENERMLEKRIEERTHDLKQAEDKLSRDLEALLTVVDGLASGDLTMRGAEADDTLGRIARAINQMIENFSNILAGINDVAFSVSSSAAEILAASTQIAKGSKHGSDQVRATSVAVDEMAASMAEVARHAEQSTGGAKRVLEYLSASEESVNATALGMTRIDATASETAEKMRMLEKRSQQIFEIIHLIEEIASQSTLLSLNAAIEAAHAGEAGRGLRRGRGGDPASGGTFVQLDQASARDRGGNRRRNASRPERHGKRHPRGAGRTRAVRAGTEQPANDSRPGGAVR